MADKKVTLTKNIYTNAHNVKCKFIQDSSKLDAYSVIETLQDPLIMANWICPVGSIVYYADNTNPATIWGGKWERFAQGKTIEGVATSDAAGTVGGEYTHLLTVAEMASHTHGLRCERNVYNGNRDTEYGGGSAASAATCGWIYEYAGHLAHNNVQPYEVYNIWRRVE